jgi:hypothetical protein
VATYNGISEQVFLFLVDGADHDGTELSDLVGGDLIPPTRAIQFLQYEAARRRRGNSADNLAGDQEFAVRAGRRRILWKSIVEMERHGYVQIDRDESGERVIGDDTHKTTVRLTPAGRRHLLEPRMCSGTWARSAKQLHRLLQIGAVRLFLSPVDHPEAVSFRCLRNVWSRKSSVNPRTLLIAADGEEHTFRSCSDFLGRGVSPSNAVRKYIHSQRYARPKGSRASFDPLSMPQEHMVALGRRRCAVQAISGMTGLGYLTHTRHSPFRGDGADPDDLSFRITPQGYAHFLKPAIFGGCMTILRSQLLSGALAMAVRPVETVLA